MVKCKRDMNQFKIPISFSTAYTHQSFPKGFIRNCLWFRGHWGDREATDLISQVIDLVYKSISLGLEIEYLCLEVCNLRVPVIRAIATSPTRFLQGHLFNKTISKTDLAFKISGSLILFFSNIWGCKLSRNLG